MTQGLYERTPEMNAAMSEATKNSDAVKSYHESMRGVSHSPEHCAAISKAQQESDGIKARNEKMRGGNDLVTHHYIYDHDDLSKYTMKMTRSRHQRLHRLMQKSGIKTPHINVTEEDYHDK